MRKLGSTVLAFGGLWLVPAAHAQQAGPEPPDLDFLEYLGSWAADDDEWLVIREWDKDGGKEGGDEQQPEPERHENDSE